MGHARRGVAGGVNGAAQHIAHVVFVAVVKQLVELRAVAGELCTGVKDFAEGFLHHCNVGANADLTAERFLNIGRC